MNKNNINFLKLNNIINFDYWINLKNIKEKTQTL
jgi:hypothetical protein